MRLFRNDFLEALTHVHPMVPRLFWGPVAGCLLWLGVGVHGLPVATASGAPQPKDNRDIRGLWVDHREGNQRKVAVWIEDCDALLCGRIYWLKKPLSAAGEPKRDRHNPDAALRDRPLCGLTILSGFRHVEEGTWSAGRIYNPNDGRTFSGTIQMEPDGSLRIRGYVGFALFGKSGVWVRPQAPPARCG